MKLSTLRVLFFASLVSACANPPSDPRASASGVSVGQGDSAISSDSEISTTETLSISFDFPVETGDLNDENIILSFGDDLEDGFLSTLKRLAATTVTCDPSRRVPDTTVAVNSNQKATIVTSGNGQLPCGRTLNMCISGVRDAQGNVLPPYSTSFKTAACEIPTNAGGVGASVSEYAPLQDSNGVDTGINSLVSNSTIVSYLKARDSKGRNIVYELLDDANGRFEILAPNRLRVKDATLFDYEESNSYDIRIKSSNPPGTEIRTETLTVNIINLNERPTTISVSNLLVGQSALAGDVIATLSVLDDDSDDVHEFEFAAGGNPGGYFTIVNNQLRRSAVEDVPPGNITLVLKATDLEGLTSTSQSFVVTVDPAATVTNVSSATANGLYALDSTVTLTVTFSSAVFVTGIPRLLLETGATDRYATYTSGSGSDSLVFTYSVQAGDLSSDLDFNSTSALELNGGTIRNSEGTNVYRALPTPGAAGSLAANKAIQVDGAVPTVTNVTSAFSNGYAKLGDTVGIQVVFSEPVVVTGTPTLSLNINDAARSLNYVSGSNSDTLLFNYTVQAGDIASDLDYFSTTALSLNGGLIRDVAGNNAVLTLTSPASAQSLGANKNIVVDGVVPTVTAVTSTSDNGSYKIGDTITVDVQFSETVSVSGNPTLLLETGDTDSEAAFVSVVGGNVLRFSFVVAASRVSADLEVQSANALVDAGLTIRDAAGNSPTLTLPTSGSSSLSGSKNIVIDGIAPNVTSVSSTTADGTYLLNQPLSITVTFDDSVTVTGSPRLVLDTGDNQTEAVYDSGSGSATLTFIYTVQSGDQSSDLNYTATNSLGLNGGTIVDSSGNAAVLTLPATGSGSSLAGSKALVVDARAPTVSSITSLKADGHYSVGEAITIRVVFSEIVDVTGVPVIALNSGGQATYASGSGSTTLDFSYTVGAGHTSSDLDIDSSAALTVAGASIADGVGNTAVLTLPTAGGTSLGGSKQIVIDTSPPEVSSVTSSFANGYAAVGAVVPIQVNFTENVTVSGTPQISLLITGAARAVNYTSGSGTTTLVFNYTVQAGDTSADLDFASSAALSENGGSLVDAAGNEADLGLVNPGEATSLGANKAIVIDGNVPTISRVDADGAMNKTHKIGDTIVVSVHFSKAVTITGTAPTLALGTSNGNRLATCSLVEAVTSTTCQYTVQDTDSTDSDINYAATNSFVHSSGTIVDAAGNSATLTLPALASGDSLASNNTINIDGERPRISSVSSSTNDGTYEETDSISIQINFDQTVVLDLAGGTPTLTLETGDTDQAATCAVGSGTSTLTCSYTVGASDQSPDLNYASIGAFALNGATLQDANGNSALLDLPALESVNSLAGSKSLVIRGAPITVASVTSSTSDGTYGQGETITALINFTGPVFVTGTPQLTFETGASDAVANYVSGSGTTQLTFSFVTASGHVTGDLDYRATDSLTLNGGTIQDASLTNINRTLPAPGAANSLGANKAIVIDAVSPTVEAVSATSDDGKYVVGNSVSVTVEFSEVVTVSGGTPRILLETGATDRYATYVSGSGTDTLVFTYEVQSGDESGDLDYVATDSLEANGATIQDALENAASLTLPNPGAAGSIANAKAIVVDGVVPSVLLVSATDANGTYIVGEAISLTVQFSDTVYVTGTPTLTLETGETDRTATYAAGSGSDTLTFTYTVQAGDSSADLNYAATDSLALSGGTIRDANASPSNDVNRTLPALDNGNSLAGQKNLVIDGVVPSVTSVSSTASNGTVLYGETITITVTFSEIVNVTNVPQLTLDIHPAPRVLDYVDGSGTTTLTFSYTVALNDQSGDNLNALENLDYVGVNSLALNGGAIADVSGNPAALALPSPGAEGSLSANKSLKIDGVAPTILNVTSTTANGYYDEGEVIDVRIQFSEAVTVSGANPIVTLETGDTDGSGTYVGVVQTAEGVNDTVVFSYTVASNQDSADLDLNATTPISNLSSIRAVRLTGGRQNPVAIASMPAAGAATSLSHNKAIVVDTTDGEVVSVTSSTDDASDKFIDSTISIQVNFSEPIIVTGTPLLALDTGGSGNRAQYVSGTGTSTLNFTYVVAPGHESSDLDYESVNSLTLNGGTFYDRAGNDVSRTLPEPGEENSLSDNENLVVDGIRPIVTSFTQDTVAGLYGLNQSVDFVVNFNSNVFVTGTPQIKMNTGRYADYVSGTGTSALTFRYTVQSGDQTTLNVHTGYEWFQDLLQGSLRDRVSTTAGEYNLWDAHTQAADAGRATYNGVENLTVGNAVPTTLNGLGLQVDGNPPSANNNVNWRSISPISGMLTDLSRTYTFSVDEAIKVSSVTDDDYAWVSTCDGLALDDVNVSGSQISFVFTEAPDCDEGDILILTVYHAGITDLADNVLEGGSSTEIYTLDKTAPSSASFNPATGDFVAMPTSVDVTLAADINGTTVTTADFSIGDTCAGATASISAVAMSGRVATVSLSYAGDCAVGETVTLTHTLTGTADLAGNSGLGSVSAVYTMIDGGLFLLAPMNDSVAARGDAKSQNKSTTSDRSLPDGGANDPIMKSDSVERDVLRKNADEPSAAHPNHSEPSVTDRSSLSQATFEFRSARFGQWRSQGLLPRDAIVKVRFEDPNAIRAITEWNSKSDLHCQGAQTSQAMAALPLEVESVVSDSGLELQIQPVTGWPLNSECHLRVRSEKPYARSFKTMVPHDFDGDGIADTIGRLPASHSTTFFVMNRFEALGVWAAANHYQDLRFVDDWAGLGRAGVLGSWKTGHVDEEANCLFGYFVYNGAGSIDRQRSSAAWVFGPYEDSAGLCQITDDMVDTIKLASSLTMASR